MVFPVLMYLCESWTVKKAEHQRIDAFDLWCWRRLLSPLDCKEIQPVHPKGDQSWVFFGRLMLRLKLQYFGYLMRRGDSLEGPMLKLKLQYSSHVMRRTDSLKKNPDAGKDWRWEKGITEDEMVGWHDWLCGHEFEKLWDLVTDRKPGMLQSMGCK